ncbi:MULTISPECIES: carboxypeptidase-like regulatory domain-containing protein [Nosocomiicoccus]|uniref:carboxypeptidase-like regulatory domain-containing protein n=1 Tax=Nosocomiicoccus TaxID=489909 RepID=UPI0008A37D89|nr:MULTISPECIES: carboxypeptidase-like regulatory domain-containing protein [Nosocomiicoccus]MDK6863942.1 carboxypeptidase-like regulatory domain-containing protein [Nosocomiicoccus ampullae]OFS62884.1 hypothetical protein HMPREF3177_04720 [Nosocomiicoccus sp. HMSC09A07]
MVQKFLNIIICILLLAPTSIINAEETDANSCNVNYSLNVKEKTIIEGNGNEGQEVELYVNDNLIGKTTVDNNSKYEFQLIDELIEQDNVKVVSEDNTINLTFKEDSENKKYFEDTYQCKKEKEGVPFEAEESTTEESEEKESSEEKPEKENDEKEEATKESSDEEKKEKSKVSTRSIQDKNVPSEELCKGVNEYNQQNGRLIGNVIPKKVTGKIQCVSNSNEFENAVTDSNVEVIVLKNDISGVGSRYFSSNYGQKILEGNGYSLTMSNNGRLYNNKTNINDIVVKNFSKLSTTNSHRNEGLFRASEISNLRLMNIEFSGGHIGASWESLMHIYGNVTLNTNADYAAYYRFYEIHDGANFTVNAENNGLHSRNNSKGSFELNGIRLGNDADAIITASGSALYSGGDYQKYVEAGSNSTLQLTSHNKNAVEFIDSKDFFITAHQDGEIILKSADSPFKSAGVGTVTIDDYGKLIMEKTGQNNAPVFDTRNSITINIYYPNSVDFINHNGPIFYSNNANKDFNIKHSSIEGYRNNIDKPDYKTPALNGDFSMRGNITNASSSITKVVPDFNESFKSSNMRMRFSGSIEAPLKVNEPVNDESTEITGDGHPNSKIKMLNTRTKKVYETTSDSNGKFTFKNIPIGDLQADGKLVFSTIVDKYEVKGAEIIVQGTIIELLPVKNLLFENTIIDNTEEKIIHRTEPTQEVNVRSTKKGGFSVNVYSKSPLTHTNGKDQLENSLYFVRNGEFNLIEGENNRQIIGNKENAEKSGDNYKFTFGKDEGILIRTNPVKATIGEYKATLVWTLTDGP